MDLELGSLAYTPETNSRLGFNYATAVTNDPGPFVSLEAAPMPYSTYISAGLLGVGIKLQPNGDVTVTFMGTVQSSSNLNQGFADVPTYPRWQYTIPKSQLKAAEHFRVRQ